MTMFAGIDYSMTSPAICVGSKLDFDSCKIFYYTTKIKLQGKTGTNIYGMMAPPYEHEMERYHNITEWAMSILLKFKVTEVCLEGYSMGSNGSRVFNIGENTGILKHTLWSKGIKYSTPAPTQVKKHFTGKGNANKDAMHQCFLDKTCVNIAELFGQKTDSNPVSDIVDSYAMFDYGMTNSF